MAGIARRSGKNSRCKMRSGRHKANGKYVRQRVRTEANRVRKQAKHRKLHPNDI